MVAFIQILIFLCFWMFIVKFFIHSKINAVEKQSSAFQKMVFGEVGLGIILPILKKSDDPRERKLIRVGNVAIFLLYLFFAAAMVIALIHFKEDF